MFRTLRGIALRGCLQGNIGCHQQPPAPPPIQKGDYSAISRYLQTRIPTQMARENVAGLSIALVNGQELIWARGVGIADKAKGLPVTPNTAFRAGALSKLLTATASALPCASASTHPRDPWPGPGPTPSAARSTASGPRALPSNTHSLPATP